MLDLHREGIFPLSSPPPAAAASGLLPRAAMSTAPSSKEIDARRAALRKELAIARRIEETRKFGAPKGQAFIIAIGSAVAVSLAGFGLYTYFEQDDRKRRRFVR